MSLSAQVGEDLAGVTAASHGEVYIGAVRVYGECLDALLKHDWYMVCFDAHFWACFYIVKNNGAKIGKILLKSTTL